MYVYIINHYKYTNYLEIVEIVLKFVDCLGLWGI